MAGGNGGAALATLTLQSPHQTAFGLLERLFHTVGPYYLVMSTPGAHPQWSPIRAELQVVAGWSPANMALMEAQILFPGTLSPVYEVTRHLLLDLGGDVDEEVSRTQVSWGSLRKFAWLTPLTRTKALLLLDLWEERTGPQLRSVIRYRDDKFTHQIEVRTVEDVQAVSALGWLGEAVSWGRKRRP